MALLDHLYVGRPFLTATDQVGILKPALSPVELQVVPLWEEAKRFYIKVIQVNQAIRQVQLRDEHRKAQEQARAAGGDPHAIPAPLEFALAERLPEAHQWAREVMDQASQKTPHGRLFHLFKTLYEAIDPNHLESYLGTRIPWVNMTG
jgi:hypothetical protein